MKPNYKDINIKSKPASTQTGKEWQESNSIKKDWITAEQNSC